MLYPVGVARAGGTHGVLSGFFRTGRGRPHPTRMAVVAGTTSIVLGLVVLLGWHLGIRSWVQVLPGFVPMQYNTALCFVLVGGGLIASERGIAGPWRQLPVAASAVGLLTLVEYAWRVDLGIDQLLMQHYVFDETSHPGRMAPNTALCFVLSGATTTGQGTAGVLGLRVRSVGAGVVGALGAVAFAGYVGGAESAYGWGELTRMAVHTALGFVVLATGIAALAVSRLQALTRGVPWVQWLPVGMLVPLTAGCCCWQFLLVEEERRIDTEMELGADVAAAVVGRELAVRIPPLRRIVRRWENSGGTGRDAWHADAQDYVRDEPIYRALQWVDPSYRVRWSVGGPGITAGQGADLGRDPARLALLESARRDRRVVLTGVNNLPQGGTGIAAYLPIYVGSRFDGFIAARLRPERLLGDVAEGIPGSYHIEVSDAGALLYGPPNAEEAHRGRYGKRREVRAYGRRWQLEVWPAARGVEAARSSLPWLVLAFLTLLAVLVPGLLLAISRIRDEANTLDQVISSSPNGILMVDQSGTITLANPEVHSIFGYPQGSLRGREVEQLVPAAGRGHHRELRVAYADAPHPHRMGAQRQVAGLHQDGHQVPIEISLAPVRTPEGPRVLAVLADITARRHAEAMLDQHARELQRSNRELEEFAYVASHDLQEPLRMVASYTELLQRRYGGALDEKADRYIHHAVDGAHRMQRLIDALLQLSRVHNEARAAVPVQTATVARQALHDLRARLAECGGTVEVGELPDVMADPVQLGQVFRNLVGNALKFTADRAPHVRVEAELPGDCQACFCVSDNGVGFAPEHAERIFSMYQRLHSREEYRGSGIGLAVVKKIIERHGGRIWATGVAGEGARFYFTLPLAEVENAVKADPAAAEA